jgi:hypothetical protein
MKNGPPRQKVTVKYGDKAQEYIIPNSAEDEKLFRAEIKWFNKLDMRCVSLLLVFDSFSDILELIRRLPSIKKETSRRRI